MPTAFDIDARGRLWVLDPVVPRIAVFSKRGSPYFDIELGPLGHRGFDLQVVDEVVWVAVQDHAFNGRFMRFGMGGSRMQTRRVFYQGDPAGLYGRVDVVDDRMFHSILVGELEDQDLFVELRPRKGHVVALEADGWPLGSATLNYPQAALDRTIPLHVSGQQSWSKDIRFRFSMRLGAKRISPNGGVSWGDLEIDPSGAMHFLLFAGTYNKKPQDGYWYLKVSPDGEVGQPIKLADPERDDGGQVSRRLTLTADGEPFAMWTDVEGLEIESLNRLRKRSL